MIIVKIQVEKDSIPLSFEFEAEDGKAVPMALGFIETLKSEGFTAPAKPIYKGKPTTRENTLEYDASAKLLKIIRVKIKDNEEADNLDKTAFRQALTAIGLGYEWNSEKFRYEVKIPDWQSLLRIDDSEYFKTYARKGDFEKAVSDIRASLAKKSKEKQTEGNPF